MVQCRVKINEEPNTVSVEVGLLPTGGALETHTGCWDDEENVFDVEGGENVLKAALTAWEGPNEFELTYDELVARGGGWL